MCRTSRPCHVSFGPICPPPAEAAILRALAKNPAERFATAAEFTQAFAEGVQSRWVAGLTAYVPGARAAAAAAAAAHDATTVPVGQGGPLPHAPKRRRVGALMTAALLLACLVIIVGVPGSGLGFFENPFVILGAFWAAPTATSTTTLALASPIGTATHIVSGKPTPINTSVSKGGGGGGGGSPSPTTRPTAVPTPPTSIYGDGSDGPLTIYSNVTDAPLDAVCSGAAGSTSLSFSSASGSFASMSGKPALIHQSQGAGAGTWMQNKIVSVSGSTLMLASPLNANYGPGAQVIALHEYTNVTINAGATWTAKAWNGSTGGILAFLASGTVTINGTISADGINGANANGTDTSAPGGPGRGFRGGGSEPAGQDAYQGEGVGGTGGLATSANGSGGGGGYESSNSGPNPGAGAGGGGNGTAGSTGSATNSSSIAGAGGSTAGTIDLSNMVFGGGGGGGAVYTGNHGGGGGGGGGIVFIAGVTITIGGTITARGGKGGSGDVSLGGGGGGAGGSVLLRTRVASGTGNIAVSGGAGGSGNASSGGNGGDGRIHVAYV